MNRKTVLLLKLWANGTLIVDEEIKDMNEWAVETLKSGKHSGDFIKEVITTVTPYLEPVELAWPQVRAAGTEYDTWYLIQTTPHKITRNSI